LRYEKKKSTSWYGLTDVNDHTDSVIINKYLANGKNGDTEAQLYAKTFLAFVTLFHERSHLKNFQHGTGDSPIKYFGYPGAVEGEAGMNVEYKLFGGIISSVNGPEDITGGVRIKKGNKEKIFSNTEIKDIVNKIYYGNFFKYDLAELGNINTNIRKPQNQSFQEICGKKGGHSSAHDGNRFYQKF